MCGICGVYSTSFGLAELKIFRYLLYLNHLRGQDSTGVVKMKRDKTYEVLKSTDASPDFLLHNPEAQNFIKSDGVFGFIGHTRAATVGKVSVENAHPFEFSKVVGVHNGTVRKFFPFDMSHDTDSEAIYHNLNDYGLKKTLENIASRSSAYALSWVNKEDHTLNFVKNKERPLHFTYIFNKHTLIWSSTESALQMIVDNCKVTPAGWDKDTDDIFTLSPHDLLQIPIGKPADDATLEHIDVDPEPPYVVKETKTKSYPTTTDFVQDFDSWEDYVNRSPNHGKTTSQIKVGSTGVWRQEGDVWVKTYTQEKKDKKEPKADGEKLPPALITPSPKPRVPPQMHWEQPVSAAEVTYRLKQGCFVCRMTVEYEDYLQDKGGVHWFSRESYCCDACYHDAGIRKMYFPEAEEGVHNH